MNHTQKEATFHKFGNKSGKLLAKLCKGPHRPTFIPSPSDPTGNIKSLPQEVSRIMPQFYSTLYAHNPIEYNLAQSFIDTDFKLLNNSLIDSVHRYSI